MRGCHRINNSGQGAFIVSETLDRLLGVCCSALVVRDDVGAAGIRRCVAINQHRPTI